MALNESAAVKGKPLIISTGMATMAEIENAISAARNVGCSDITQMLKCSNAQMLKCSNSYPAAASQSSLMTIPNLRRWTTCEAGFFDQTEGIGSAIASVALGVSMIEKHMTDDRKLSAVDSAFTFEPQEFGMLIRAAKEAWTAPERSFFTNGTAPSLIAS